MSRLGVWIEAARPRTLTMAAAPVVLGAALAVATTGAAARLLPAVVALFSALCIQIATNLFNDVHDFQRGGDGPERLGPKRAAASGALSPRAIFRAAIGAFGLAALGGLYLVWVGGWPILLLGLLSILFGWAYSGGPRPISFTPFGEVFVVAFFGLGAVGGTFFLCVGHLDGLALVAGLALGCFAAGVLMVNNIRDAPADARVGRRTLAIVAGPRRSRWIFAGLMAAPFALLGFFPPRDWLALGAAAPAALAARRLFALAPGPEMNALLAATAQTQALFSALLCVGALWLSFS